MKKNKLPRLLALPLIIPSLNAVSQAEEYSHQDAHVEVTTSGDQELSEVTLEKMIIQAGEPVKAFQTSKLIKKNLGSSTDGADLLKQTPGISVTRQGGTASDPVLRGLGGSRLNILIGGVPFDGVCNHRMDPATAYVDPGSFDNLTLLKGPQSVRYGLSISGAVSFEPADIRYDELGARGYSRYQYGSFNQQNLDINVSAGYEKGYIAYIHNNKRGSNYDDGHGDEIEQTFYNSSKDKIAVGFTPDEETLVEFSGLRSGLVAGNATIHMDITKSDRESYNFHFKKENISSWLQAFDLKYNYYIADHEMDNFSLRPLDHGKADSEYILMSQYLKHHFVKAEIVTEPTSDIEVIAGLSYRHDSYDAKAHNLLTSHPEDYSPPPASIPLNAVVAALADRKDFREAKDKAATWNPVVDFDRVNAYVEVGYQMNDALRWVSGFGIESLGTRTGDMHKAGETSVSYVDGRLMRRRQTLFGGFVRAEYQFDELPILMSAGYGHAERAPDYWEVYSMGAFSLNPEKNNQIDIMMSYNGEAFSASLSAFYSHITDFIITKDGDKSQNVTAQRAGAELSLGYRITDSFSIKADVSYTHGDTLDFVDKHAPSAARTEALRLTPPLEGNIILDYDDDTFSGSFTTRLVRKQERIHARFGNTLTLDTTPTGGFVVSSLKLGYTPHPIVKFEFGINNLFNKKYAEHINRAATAGPVIGGKLTEPGRAYWGAVTINFDLPYQLKGI